ncbi:MAG: magnesium transporter [Paraglaciecola sp.]
MSLDDFQIINATEKGQLVKEVSLSGFGALTVVDKNQKLIGRIDVTAAAELMQEYYEGQIMASAGMDENEDLLSPHAKALKQELFG